MVSTDSQAQWRAWAEKEFGGPEAKLEVVTDAAMTAVNQGQPQANVVAAAQQAEAEWTRSFEMLRPRDPRSIRGQVVAFQTRMEPSGTGPGSPEMTVWSFRIQGVDDAGSPLPQATVEMRGLTFEGAIQPGDIVEVRGSWPQGDVLSITDVFNVTANTEVVARGYAKARRLRKLGLGLRLIFIVIWLAIIVAIVAFVLHQQHVHL